VLEGAAPLEPPPEALTPVEVGECLRAAGLLPGGLPTLYLAGHRGGQVSRAAGDFVFTCSAVYDLSDGAAPRASAILSGKNRSALAAIVGALGGLVLDARGRCVKAGQVVPTSGGSHAFVVLERHAEIQVSGG
jgi:TldD protein